VDNILTQRYLDIKDLPTTIIEILDASHTDSNYAKAKVYYSKWDEALGTETTETIELTKQAVLHYRQQLLDEKDRLTLLFNNLTAFAADAQVAIDQWLIDNPPEEP